MKVWVVTYHNGVVEGVFSTETVARAFIDKYPLISFLMGEHEVISETAVTSEDQSSTATQEEK
jgi:hypothetical protein